VYIYVIDINYLTSDIGNGGLFLFIPLNPLQVEINMYVFNLSMFPVFKQQSDDFVRVFIRLY